MLTMSVIDTVLSTACLLVVAVLGALFVRRKKASSSLPFPPGPPPLPLIGNLLDMPTVNVSPTFHQMCRKYGDIIHLSVFGQSTVVIDSYDAAVELLEQRSLQTSGRPRLVMAELSVSLHTPPCPTILLRAPCTDRTHKYLLLHSAGLAWQFSVERYTPAWRRYRRTFHEFFHQGAVACYRGTHKRVSRSLLTALLDDPPRFLAHAHRQVSRPPPLSLSSPHTPPPRFRAFILARRPG
uniref:Cytochrome P450 33C9 n=1 Tax=Ganoderma boninense TaxID=34458 RepID=A0A5K1JUA7_9APHY|nr:Cytochrome P450 33C9 [Ganoderma boninense]